MPGSVDYTLIVLLAHDKSWLTSNYNSSCDRALGENKKKHYRYSEQLWPVQPAGSHNGCMELRSLPAR